MSDSCAVERQLPHHPALWRGGRLAAEAPSGLPTGFGAIDSELPGRGWPVGALTELLTDHQGSGELSLLLPALAQLSKSGRGIVLVGAPFLPYAPALQNAGLSLEHCLIVESGDATRTWWAAEQALRSGACGAVVAWANHEQVADPVLRRLQLAAEASLSAAFVYRPVRSACNASPAKLRLVLTPAGAYLLHVSFLKRSGLPGEKSLVVGLPGRREAAPALTHAAGAPPVRISTRSFPASTKSARARALTH